jgi:hypothetical protein
MNLPTYGFEDRINEGLIDLNLSFVYSRATPVGLLEGLRKESDYALPVKVIDNAAKKLFPYHAPEVYPHGMSPGAQAASGGMVLALFLSEELGAEPTDIRTILSQRLDLEVPKTDYPNDAEVFITAGIETLEDLEIIPLVIPSCDLARDEQTTRSFNAGFGFVLSAALEEYVMRHEAA